MATKVKAKDLRDGDRVIGDDGHTYTVVRNRQVKIKIPARMVKQQRLVVEASKRKDGRASKKTDIITTWDSDSFEIEDRMDLKSKYERFMSTHSEYVNAFAATVTGSILTIALHSASVVTDTGAAGMLAATMVIGAALTYRAYTHA
jgi:hypothetical protein